jgi:hypothetical protein
MMTVSHSQPGPHSAQPFQTEISSGFGVGQASCWGSTPSSYSLTHQPSRAWAYTYPHLEGRQSIQSDPAARHGDLISHPTAFHGYEPPAAAWTGMPRPVQFASSSAPRQDSRTSYLQVVQQGVDMSADALRGRDSAAASGSGPQWTGLHTDHGGRFDHAESGPGQHTPARNAAAHAALIQPRRDTEWPGLELKAQATDAHIGREKERRPDSGHPSYYDPSHTALYHIAQTERPTPDDPAPGQQGAFLTQPSPSPIWAGGYSDAACYASRRPEPVSYLAGPGDWAPAADGGGCGGGWRQPLEHTAPTTAPAIRVDVRVDRGQPPRPPWIATAQQPSGRIGFAPANRSEGGVAGHWQGRLASESESSLSLVQASYSHSASDWSTSAPSSSGRRSPWQPHWPGQEFESVAESDSECIRP